MNKAELIAEIDIRFKYAEEIDDCCPWRWIEIRSLVEELEEPTEDKSVQYNCMSCGTTFKGEIVKSSKDDSSIFEYCPKCKTQIRHVVL